MSSLQAVQLEGLCIKVLYSLLHAHMKRQGCILPLLCLTSACILASYSHLLWLPHCFFQQATGALLDMLTLHASTRTMPLQYPMEYTKCNAFDCHARDRVCCADHHLFPLEQSTQATAHHHSRSYPHRSRPYSSGTPTVRCKTYS